MHIKDVMQKLSFTFEYDNLKKAIHSRDENAIAEAVQKMNQKENAELESTYRQLASCNFPPNPDPEAVIKFAKESLLMQDLRTAIKQWRRKFMPIWAEAVELIQEELLRRRN